jgi:hypothetical protein
MLKKIMSSCLLVVLLVLAASNTAYASGPSPSYTIDKASQQFLIDNNLNGKSDAEIVEFLKIKADKELANKIQPPPLPMALLYTDVTLGDDIVFYTADTGYSANGKDGTCLVWDNDSDYYTSYRKVESFTMNEPLGFGSAWAYASVGKLFTTSGGGGQSANLRMTGYYDGLLLVAGAANCGVDITLNLYDYTASSGTSYTILSESRSVAGYSQWDTVYFNVQTSVYLQSGHDYCAYLQLATDGQNWVTGGCSSDWGTYDYDPGDAHYLSISIDF